MRLLQPPPAGFRPHAKPTTTVVTSDGPTDLLCANCNKVLVQGYNPDSLLLTHGIACPHCGATNAGPDYAGPEPGAEPGTEDIARQLADLENVEAVARGTAPTSVPPESVKAGWIPVDLSQAPHYSATSVGVQLGTFSAAINFMQTRLGKDGRPADADAFVVTVPLALLKTLWLAMGSQLAQYEAIEGEISLPKSVESKFK
jgi:hypothetical protein